MTTKFIFTIIPFAVPSLYLFYLYNSLSKRVTCTVNHSISPTSTTTSLPTEIKSNPSNYVIAHEIASKSVATKSLPNYGSADQLLTEYLRDTMKTFTYLPQAYLIKKLIKSAAEKKSYEHAYINSLSFVPGDVVCGTYRVVTRKPNHVELSLFGPETYTGPVFDGLLIVSIEERDEWTVFLNETVMWRKTSEGKVLLESAFGKWFHALTARVLVDRGTKFLVGLGQKID
jgi:hypothetical protein